MKKEIALTSDGSSSIFIPELNEHYHSHHGAVQEARHVFIAHGLHLLSEKRMAIFEVGFGTGLNALLSSLYAQQKDIHISYDTIEAFPVENNLLDQLNYTKCIEGSTENWTEIHSAEWGREVEINRCFSISKIHQKIEDYSIEREKYDGVFFDAFGPRAQSEMWAKNILLKMFEGLKSGGILVTYCAQGQMKRDLKEIGFSVKSYPGPPGKREMTVAIKSN